MKVGALGARRDAAGLTAGVADAKGARRLNLLLADMHRKNGRSQVRMNS